MWLNESLRGTGVVLASASPRRKELLARLTDRFTVDVSAVEEVLPEGLALTGGPEYLARIKCAAVAERHPGALVIGSDTGVFIDGKMLGKPHSREEGFAMLKDLSGRSHSVITGVCLRMGDRVRSFSEETRVRFFPLTDAQIAAYLDTGEYCDKAGAYGIQGEGALLVEGIDGCYYNVMGFPVSRLAREIDEFLKEC